MSESDVTDSNEALLQEIRALKKINSALMNRVERSIDSSGASFSLFESNILLQKKIQERTHELERQNKTLVQVSEAAEQAKRSFQTLLGNLQGMVYRCQNDSQWTMEFVSDGVFELTGYTGEELIGNRTISFSELIIKSDQQRVWDLIQAALMKRERFQVVYRIQTRGGEEREVWEQGTGIFSATGEVVAVEGYVIDISEQKENERKLEAYRHTLEDQVEVRTQQLNQEKVKVEAANNAKDNFLASMSHELRTPLTSIIGNSEYLLENCLLDQEGQGVVRSIESAGRRQLALVNDILDMSKITSGKFTIDERPYDLSQLLREIESMLSVRAQDAGVDLLVQLKGEVHYHLLGDAQRIAQILINLLGNAIKFTHEGSVTLTAWVDAEALLFQVRDTGIGMSPEVQERLFQRFEQADGTISRRFGGSGLGLFISLSLAELMGGSIDASSQEGEGSLFQLKLPYRRTTTPVSQHSSEISEQSVLDQQFTGDVLIAEDTPELQLLERRILEGMGVSVATANDGREAVEMAQEGDFDLILMDMQMPEMDGIEATRTIRALRIATPVVPLTANVMQKHRDAFTEVGCEEFLSKPIDKQALRRVLNKYLMLKQDKQRRGPLGVEERRQTERRAVESAVIDAGGEQLTQHRLQSQVNPEVDASPAVDVLIDDELKQLFVERIEVLKEEFTQAFNKREWEGAYRAAHTIAGSAATFGYPKLTSIGKALCKQIQQGGEAHSVQLSTDLMVELERMSGSPEGRVTTQADND